MILSRFGTLTLKRPAFSNVYKGQRALASSRVPYSPSSTATRRLFSTEGQPYSAKAAQRKNISLAVAGALFLAGLHSATGSQNDFFDYRFTTEKSPDDLATFYGGEEFMELFCIFPFVGQLMMRNGQFDEKGNVITTGIPGQLRVSMVFSDDTSEATGETEWFNKRERFRDSVAGWTAWDMVINFGFRTREDGEIEVYHYGEYFHGNLPVVSQIMKLVFKVHARWLAWSTEHHINHYAFSENEEEEKLEEESRRNMPMFLLRNYAWTDLMAMIFGRKVEKPSFLLKKHSGSDEPLPIQRAATQLVISQDIETDRLTTKGMLARHGTQTPEDVHVLLMRKSLAQRSDEQETDGVRANAYGVATETARLRRLSRAETRRLSRTTTTQRSSATVDTVTEAKGSVTNNTSPANNALPEKGTRLTEEDKNKEHGLRRTMTS